METPSVNLNQVNQSPLLNSNYTNPDYLFAQGSTFIERFWHYITSPSTVGAFHTFLIFICIFFLTLIFYCLIRLFEIRAKEHKHLHHELAEYAHHQSERDKKKKEGEGISKNARWRQVLAYLFSTSMNDWRLAIIEADSMLEELLEQMGFKGESIGERLKATDREKFRSLTIAWEVHTIRNRIAHEGSAFQLSHYEAKRVIALYEQIFREFGFI